jgi:hypothetical protein
MRLLKFLLGIYCIFCFMACESDDLEIQGSQGANKTEKKSLNTFDYWYPSINISKYFSSYYLPPILDYIKNDDLAAVGVFINNNGALEPPSYDNMQMYLKWDNGWSIILGGSSGNDLYLLYNKPIPKSKSYYEVPVTYNYPPVKGSIIFNQNGTYHFDGGRRENDALQVVLGVDKTDTVYGFKFTYVSACFENKWNDIVPCTIWTSDLSENENVYPKR